jgi:hypothetical protein
VRFEVLRRKPQSFSPPPRPSAFLGGGSPSRRRGARLGLLIALLAILPGLVSATIYTTTTAAGTAKANFSNQGTATCGWVQGPGYNVIGSGGALGYISAAPALPAAGSAPIPSTTVTLYSYETGFSGYQYMVGEVALECTTQAASGLNGTVTISSGSQVTGADWVSMSISTVAPTTGTNPTAGATCDAAFTNGATAQSKGLFNYAGETASTEAQYVVAGNPKNSYSGGTDFTWSANASTPAWTDDSCTTTTHTLGGHTNLIQTCTGGVTPCNYISGWTTGVLTICPSNSLTNADVLWLSFAWVAESASGLSGTQPNFNLAFSSL